MPVHPVVSPDALRRARHRAGLTQHELARIIGVAGGERVSRWELGSSTPRPGLLQRLAEALDVPLRDLLAPAGEPPDLRRLRAAAGLSAREVADRAHMSLPTLKRWEAGGILRMPSRAALCALADALGVNVESLEAALTRSSSQGLGARSARQ